MSSEDYRLSFHEARDALAKRLTEPAPGRIQLLAGPRQVGKTTLLLDLAKQHAKAAIYAAADGPEAALPGFWERLWIRAEETASSEGRALVLLDEAHLLHDWAGHLKSEWDRLRRKKLPIQVVATGSSALKLAHGSRESLTGRFERITLTHWSAASLAEVFGVPPAEACELLIKMGSYPGAFELRDDFTRWSAYVRDADIPSSARWWSATTKLAWSPSARASRRRPGPIFSCAGRHERPRTPLDRYMDLPNPTEPRRARGGGCRRRRSPARIPRSPRRARSLFRLCPPVPPRSRPQQKRESPRTERLRVAGSFCEHPRRAFARPNAKMAVS